MDGYRTTQGGEEGGKERTDGCVFVLLREKKMEERKGEERRGGRGMENRGRGRERLRG